MTVRTGSLPGRKPVQAASDFDLEFMDGLNRVPSRRPHARRQLRRRLAFELLHRESQGRILVLNRLGLVYIDVCRDRRSTAVTMRLTRDRLADPAKIGGRRDSRYTLEIRHLVLDRSEHFVQPLPRRLRQAFQLPLEFRQPPPARLNRFGGNEYLEEPLGATFIVYQRPCLFGKRRGRQDKAGFLGCRRGAVIHRNDMYCLLEESVHIHPAIQVILKDKQSLRRSGRDRIQPPIRHQRQADTVALRNHKKHSRFRIQLTKSLRHAGGGLDDRFASETHTGNNRRPSCLLQRLGDPRSEFQSLPIQIGDVGRLWIELVNDGKPKAGNIVGRGTVGCRRLAIEFNLIRCGDEKGSAIELNHFADRAIMPGGDTDLTGRLLRFLNRRVPERQVQHRRRVCRVFAENQHGIRLFHLAKRSPENGPTA